MIEVLRANTNEITIDKKEILRYLGCKAGFEDEAAARLVDDALAEFESTVQYKACFDVFEIEPLEDGFLNLGFAKVHSKALFKNLNGCRQIVLFVATIGTMTDRLIMRYSSLQPSRAAIFQAIGAAAIESWCDVLTKRISGYDFMCGKYFLNRFSPGYGDLELELQKNIFSALDCGRKIGVTLSQSLMMLPSKSVSAIIGISDVLPDDSLSKCRNCKTENCEYRRG